MTEWVKCSDKMPQDYDWCLVCTDQRHDSPICIACWAPDHDLKCWRFFDNSTIQCCGPYCGDSFSIMGNEEITHWMPLPELPHD